MKNQYAKYRDQICGIFGPSSLSTFSVTEIRQDNLSISVPKGIVIALLIDPLINFEHKCSQILFFDAGNSLQRLPYFLFYFYVYIFSFLYFLNILNSFQILNFVIRFVNLSIYHFLINYSM